MIFKYNVVTSEGEEKSGTIDAVSEDVAITSLQRKGYIVSSVTEGEGGSFFKMEFKIFERVSNKEIVILSRQISTLFEFYVNMVRSGQESGQLNEIFMYLADYLDRTYDMVSKARNALIYPAFVIFVFIAVMVLMLTLVIPQLTSIIIQAGQTPPIYTRIVIGVSDFLINYGLYLLALIIAVSIGLWFYGDRF
jgi:type II secretory pathway component PulF